MFHRHTVLSRRCCGRLLAPKSRQVFHVTYQRNNLQAKDSRRVAQRPLPMEASLTEILPPPTAIERWRIYIEKVFGMEYSIITSLSSYPSHSYTIIFNSYMNAHSMPTISLEAFRASQHPSSLTHYPKSPYNSGGSPAMQAPPATRRPTSGQRWQHGTNVARNNCRTSSAVRPWPT